MATAQMNAVIRQLRRTVFRQDGASKTDGQLLASFIERKEESAFEAILHRHGAMVFGVCRRMIGNHHDAEDAFQATFLVLARRASSVKPRERLANWLHGVALRTAMKVRSMSTKTRSREQQVTQMPEPAAKQQDHWRDLQPLLDQELNGLPENYRLPILLCDLEGKTIKQATQQLGWRQGTFSSRLVRGRKLLSTRLANRGVVLSGSVLAAVVSQNAATAGVPTSLMSSTIKAATVAGAVPAKVAILTEGVLKAMLMSKLKAIVVVVLALGFMATGATGITCRTAEAQNEKPQPGNGRTVITGADSFQKPKAGSEPEAKTDKELLEGVWRVVSLAIDGKEVAKDELERVPNKIVFAGDMATVYDGPGIKTKGTYRIDPAKKPKSLDVSSSEGKTVRLIYKLEGDTLTIGESGGSNRPEDFTGKEVAVTVLKRVASAGVKHDASSLPPKVDVERQYTITSKLVEIGTEKPKAVLSPRLTLPDGQTGSVIIDDGPKNLLERVILDENIKIGTSFDVRVKRLQGNRARLFLSFAINEIERADVSEIRVLGNSVQAIQDVELHKSVKIIFQKDAKGAARRWVEITVDEVTVPDEQPVPPPADAGARSPANTMK